MPLYFYHMKDDRGWSYDSDGLDLEDIADVKRELLAALGELVKERLGGEDLERLSIEVKNGNGEPLISATVSIEVIDSHR